MATPATLIPGDGIGPEVVAATVEVLEATGVAFDWDEQPAGLGAFEATGDPLPPATIASIERTRLALKGPLTTPVGTGFKSINVRLRQHFSLYANVRPCATLPNTHGPFTGIDLVLYRENTEGLYSGIEHFDAQNQIADSISRVTRRGSERIIRYAFEDVRRRGRKRLTLAHKANILKETGGLFLSVGRDIARSTRTSRSTTASSTTWRCSSSSTRRTTTRSSRRTSSATSSRTSWRASSAASA